MRRALVSHSTSDDGYVAEMESFLRAAGFDHVFNDGKAIQPDEKFWPVIEKGIAECDTLVAVISAASNASEWVRREVEYGRSLSKRIIAVWIEDCPVPPSFADRDVIDFRSRTRGDRPINISRIVKYALAELIGRDDELKLLTNVWGQAIRAESPRHRILTFVALGGEGKTSLVAKWAADLAHRDWPGCDAVFAWSFYSQGTREQVAASSDLFLEEALTFFGDAALAGSAQGAFDKGRRLAQLVGERRALLVLDGLEPLQYAPTAPTPGQLKDQGIGALLKGLAAASHGLCVVTTRYSLPDLKAFWQTTAPEVKLLRLSREAGVRLLKILGVKGSELRNIPFTPSPASQAPKHFTQASDSEAPKRALQASPGQRPGLANENDPALKGRDKTNPDGCAAPSGLDSGAGHTQGDALGWPASGRWPAESEPRSTGGAARGGSTGGPELVNEFEKLVEDVKGHALTLTLLGGFLSRAFHGDIRQRDRVKFEKADEKMDGGHAFRTMAAYEQWLLRDGGDEGRREVAVLRLMGLFDRPADAGCLAALRREPIPGLTEPLAGLADDDWEFCLSGLEAAKLLTVNRDATGALVSLDAHPHLREYFAKRLKDEGGRMKDDAGTSSFIPHPSSFQLAHRRLYEHLCATTQEGDQPTLEALQPLYQAVAHGCQAGLQQKACDEVYFTRIQRGQEYYSARKLGAFGSDLGAVACFFEQPWSRVTPTVTEANQAWLLNEAACRLRASGRLTESLEPMRAGLKMCIKQEVWKSAAVVASNLSELELTLGLVAGAVGDAEQSVTYADRSGDAFQRMGFRTTHADALHQAGRRAEAETRFREAEQMQAASQPADPLLYSLQGFQYCDLLLLAAPERAAWLECLGSAGAPPAVRRALAPDIGLATAIRSHADSEADGEGAVGSDQGGRAPQIQSCRAVSQRAAKIFEWRKLPKWKSAYDPLLDIALDHLTLGRAALYEAILSHSDLRVPMSELDSAVAGLRRAGVNDYVVRGLLTRAWLRFLTGARIGPESAQEDLDEAWEIAERGPMPLFLADIHLHRARLFFHEAKYPWDQHPDGTPRGPKDDLAAARRLIEKCGYRRRKEELEDAERCILK